jgi:hypothetical protein
VGALQALPAQLRADMARGASQAASEAARVAREGVDEAMRQAVASVRQAATWSAGVTALSLVLGLGAAVGGLW